MPCKWIAAPIVCWLASPSYAHAAGDHAPLDLPVWSVVPFVALLLGIAVLPILAEHWWHKNRNKALISALVALPVLVYLAIVHFTTEQQSLLPLGQEMFKYVSFIILLASLYTVAGGIVFGGDVRGTPA